VLSNDAEGDFEATEVAMRRQQMIILLKSEIDALLLTNVASAIATAFAMSVAASPKAEVVRTANPRLPAVRPGSGR
jgi:hypothetical protein